MSPMYDRSCKACEHRMEDCWEPVTEPHVTCPKCGAHTQRTWFQKPANVVGDECDILAQNGLCNPDGTPRRYTSKQEMREEAARRGLVNHVEHIGERGSDRSKHTTRWI